jgi:hypothetical protein
VGERNYGGPLQLNANYSSWSKKLAKRKQSQELIILGPGGSALIDHPFESAAIALGYFHATGVTPYRQHSTKQ